MKKEWRKPVLSFLEITLTESGTNTGYSEAACKLDHKSWFADLIAQGNYEEINLQLSYAGPPS